ncbi:unnamed protein product [Paramecium octaurelia]|uniref:U3 small nucleolar RNA-associated protein 25 n=1 Tax=Paramecium octaurelia TaxID=43137 RepID=A0A8S1VBD9_PAROT|nr:unnamed protein product [Paramecium octaurelia]
MGKKNKKQKNQDNDPIVKQIRKKKPQQIKKQEQVEEITDEEEISEQQNEDDQVFEHVVDFKNANEKPSHYQNLLKKLNVKQQLADDNYGSSESARLNIKQENKSVYAKMKKYEVVKLPNDNPFSHFEYDHQELRKTICIGDIEIEQPEQLNAFFKEKTTKLVHTLNNGVEFKKYELNKQLKNKTLIDLNCKNEDYNIETLSQKQLIKDDKFVLPVVKDSEDEKELLQSNIIYNYFDYIETDPEEQNAEKFRKTYITHITNHLDKEKESYGFTRCKVLILTAFKGDAISIINQLIQTDKEVVNKERYENEFCDEERLEEDDFRIGIQFSRQGYVKLHANFDKSDIIVTSTLGMRLIIGTEDQKHRETHFLSSIEILVIDRASSIYMQNWSYLEDILEATNLLPNHKNITSELSSIRPYCFENLSKFYRQNIVYTDHYFQELNFLRKQYFTNYKGCISNKIYYNQLFQKSVNFQQEFRQIDCSNTEQQIEQRFNQFKKLWNDIENNKGSQFKKTLIFVQSYFDFVALKGHFKRINSNCECVSEYTKKSKVQSIISKFKDGRIQYIMMTERAYFFEIIQLRSMKNIIFYQLPQHSIIYKQLIQSIENLGNKTQIITYYSKFDAYQLETIVGTLRAEEMISEQNKRTTFIL